MNDNEFMKEAYKEALIAYKADEYPVGAILVQDNKIISRLGNQTKSHFDPTAHAEILVIREACRKLKKRKLEDCILYTTLFPCPMCENAILETGIRRVVYGATSFKWVKEIKFDKSKLELWGPIMEEECKEIFIKKLQEKERIDILEYEKA